MLKVIVVPILPTIVLTVTFKWSKCNKGLVPHTKIASNWAILKNPGLLTLKPSGAILILL
jgi:hypothetical protein